MATSTDLLIFRHHPLQDAKTHIRLLKVVGVDETRPTPVRCELTAFAIAEAPPYRAISYTWGDPAFLSSILVNGQTMDVRLNCEYALRQASHDEGSEAGDSFIWIDSICVNQNDNDEKGAQVAMMGDIFKTASRVLACVGSHEDDSELLYEFLRGEGTRIESLLLADAPRYSDGCSDTSFMHNSIPYRRLKIAWRWKHPRSVLIRLCEAVGSFLARPYFRRVWIYQELFLGRDMSVYCGYEKVPISWLWVTSSVIRSWMNRRTHYWLFMELDLRIRVRPNIREAMPLLLAGANELSPIPFLQATEESATLSCENPRDRVYGILSITTPTDGHHFQPDYTKDRMELALEVLKRCTSEIISDDLDFSRLTDIAKAIGLNLNLRDEPSQQLIHALDLRQSSIHPQDAELDISGKRGETNGTDKLRFFGFEVLFQQEKWVCRDQDEWFRRRGSKMQPPELTKCLQGEIAADALGDIRLPPETQNGDWVLIPYTNHWLSRTYSFDSRVVLLARHHDSEKFEIIGKVLISKWVTKWNKVLDKRSSKFQVYCDHEDLLALFAVCHWEALWWLETSVSSDTIFQTRFCGQRFSSYAIRTKT